MELTNGCVHSRDVVEHVVCYQFVKRVVSEWKVIGGRANEAGVFHCAPRLRQHRRRNVGKDEGEVARFPALAARPKLASAAADI
jgi:hypothetical protein